MRLAWIVVLVLSCKGKDKPAGSASASGSAPGATIDAATPPAKAGIEIDPTRSTTELVIAFDNKLPKLPAINADGTLIADFDSDATTMMFPSPYHFEVRPIDGKGKPERIEILDMKSAMELGKDDSGNWDTTPPAPETVKLLREHAAAVTKRLEGFTSLVDVDVKPDSDGNPQPARVGDLELSSTELDHEKLAIRLTKAGALRKQATLKSYSDGVKPSALAGAACTYNPMFASAYTDRGMANLYIEVRFHFHEECTKQPPRYIVWPLAGDDPEAELFTMFAEQFDAGVEMDKVFAPDAVFVAGNELATENIPYIIKANGEIYSGHEGFDIVVTLSRDGQTAWVSGVESLSLLPPNEPGRDDEWRATNLATKTPKGWRFIATIWTQPVANAKANKDAKAGKLKPQPAFTVDKGDASLNEAFAKLLTDGLDADARENKNLVAFGSGPGERTAGGAVLAKGMDAGWKGKATVSSSIARLAPSGTTGWVVGNVELAKGSYKIPFQLFAVFDKTTAGAWTLVHLHFSI